MSMVVKKNLSFNTIKKLAFRAAEKIQAAQKHYSAIICVGRGGMVPSRLMSEALDVRQIYFVDAKAYTNDDKLGKVECHVNLPDIKGPVLIVDDCMTSGSTIAVVKKHLMSKILDVKPVVDVCVMYMNKHVKADVVYGTKYDANKVWLVFPWEN